MRALLQGSYPGFEQARVTVLDKLTYAGNRANLEPVAASPGFSFIRGDICDGALLSSVVPGHDAVINFAAETHVDRSIAGASPFVTNLLDGLKVPLYGDGQNVRGWLHVDDHCRGIQLVLERGEPGGVYHINGDTELTNIELARALLECCGADWEMVAHVEDRKGHDRRYSLDDSLLRSMGFAPRIRFSQGLADTVRWYQRNRGWWEPLKRAAHGVPAARGQVTL